MVARNLRRQIGNDEANAKIEAARVARQDRHGLRHHLHHPRWAGHDQQIEPSMLRIVAECMAGAFDFTDEEQAAFVKWAMANHEGEAEEDDDA